MTVAGDPAILAAFPEPAVDAPLVWVPCGHCWGQKRQYVQTASGSWWGRDCPRCFGVGETTEVPST